MKRLLFLVFFVPVLAFSQEYKSYSDFKYFKDTLLIEGKKIKIGDTVRLGTGSRSDNSFSYVYKKPTMMNAGNSNTLQNKYANAFMVLGELEEKNLASLTYVIPIFYINGNKSMKYAANLSSALKYKEILLP